MPGILWVQDLIAGESHIFLLDPSLNLKLTR